MKKVSKKKKKKFNFKEWIKGFTLVELLAVIVILAIIMIIAIPNVLNVMEQSKKKSFITFAQKINKQIQEKYLQDSMTKSYPISNGYNYISYNIDELGISSVGNYRGVASILIDTRGSEESFFVQIILADDDYYIVYDAKKEFGAADLDVASLSKTSEVESQFVASGMTNFKVKNFVNKELLKNVIENYGCNTIDVHLIDGVTTNELTSIPNHSSNFSGDTCTGNDFQKAMLLGFTKLYTDSL